MARIENLTAEPAAGGKTLLRFTSDGVGQYMVIVSNNLVAERMPLSVGINQHMLGSSLISPGQTVRICVEVHG